MSIIISKLIKVEISIFIVLLLVSIFLSNPYLLFPKDNKNRKETFPEQDGLKTYAKGAVEIKDNENSTHTTVNISTLQSYSSITIDGRLDEPIYEELVPISNLFQSAPDEGEPMSEATEAYIFYDGGNIYFCFKCYDSEPDKIVTKLESRDASRRISDRIFIILDTFHDMRTGFIFGVSARGIQFDATVMEIKGSSPYDFGWNGIWQSATSIFNGGWMLEIAVPFKALKFPSKSVQTWGMNLMRVIPRKNERGFWPPRKRFEQSGGPSKSGVLLGLRDLPHFHNLDLIPFATLRPQTSSEYQSGRQRFFYNGGLDVKYNLSPNLVANMTISPDFSQTEVDEDNVQLSRWELFYPEKREFFTEGSHIFRTPLQLFFSRRIGSQLPDNSEQRVLFGSKITGKLGKQSIGIIETLTNKTNYLYRGDSDQVEGANFFVFRVQRDVLKKSSIGFLSVNRDQKEGATSHSQRAHGVDFYLAFGDNVRIGSQVALSSNLGGSKRFRDNLAYFTNFSFSSNFFDVSLTRRDIGERFDISQIGYYPEVDRVGNELTLKMKPYMDRWGIRQLTFVGEFNQFGNHQGEQERSHLKVSFDQEWKNFWRTGMSLSTEKELYYIFHQGEILSEKILYRLPKRISFFLSIPRTSTISGRINISTGDFIDYKDYYLGKSRNFSLDFNVKVGAKLRLGGRVNYIQEFFSDGKLDEVRGLYLMRVAFNFSSKLSSRILAQYNIERTQLTSDALISYELTSRSGLSLGFRDRRNLEVMDNPMPEDTRVFFRFSYLLSF